MVNTSKMLGGRVLAFLCFYVQSKFSGLGAGRVEVRHSFRPLKVHIVNLVKKLLSLVVMLFLWMPYSFGWILHVKVQQLKVIS